MTTTGATTKSNSLRQSLAVFLVLVCALGVFAQLPLLRQLLSHLAVLSNAHDSALSFITNTVGISNNRHRLHQQQYHELETTVHCKGYCCHSLEVNNRSCHYQNLYLEVTPEGSVFWAFVVDRHSDGDESGQLLGDPVSLVVSTHTRLYCLGPFPPGTKASQPNFFPHPYLCSTENITESTGRVGKMHETTKFDVMLFAGPKVKRFATEAELVSFVKSMSTDGKLARRRNVHVMFENHWNFGHHVLEAIYAAWTSTAKFGLENETICFVTTPGSVPHNSPDGKPLSADLDPSSTFGGCPRVVWEELTAVSTERRWVRFDQFIFGASGSGMEHRNEYYEASMHDPGADDVTYLPRRFRSRMYDSYSVLQPQGRKSSGGDRVRNKNGLIEIRAALLPNKRDWGNLNAMSDAINTQLASYTPTLGVSGQVDKTRISAQVVDWSQYNTLRSQLELLRTIDIYISSVGTALTLQYFLPDGAIVVNVGYEDGFWEEHLVAGNRHLGAVYPTTVKSNRSSDEVVALVQEAADKILSNFSIPVQRGQSLSRYGKAFSKFLRSDEGRSLHILPMINFQYQMDYSAGSRSRGCYRVVGHLASAFYWACGNKYHGTRFNARCHPLKDANGNDYMSTMRRENDLWCPKFKNINRFSVTVSK